MTGSCIVISMNELASFSTLTLNSSGDATAYVQSCILLPVRPGSVVFVWETADRKCENEHVNQVRTRKTSGRFAATTTTTTITTSIIFTLHS